MAFFDRMMDSFSAAGQGVSQKAKATTESIRINNLIKANERMMDKLIHQVGLRCVERHVTEKNTEYEDLFSEILRLREENNKNRQELQRLSEGNVCPSCGYNNSETARFCVNCGAPLAQKKIIPATSEGKICPACGFANGADASFCVECGNPLSGPQTAPHEVSGHGADVQGAESRESEASVQKQEGEENL